MSGKVPFPWDKKQKVDIIDSAGNKLSLPASTSISLVLSLIHMIKTIVNLNIFRVHIDEIKNTSDVIELGRHVSLHLPFFAVSTFFRLVSIPLMICYMNNYLGSLPICIFFFFNIVIGIQHSDE